MFTGLNICWIDFTLSLEDLAEDYVLGKTSNFKINVKQYVSFLFSFETTDS